jgi:4-amino-4-deoxy-L-arabinose transferase-like glycosyltransferase
MSQVLREDSVVKRNEGSEVPNRESGRLWLVLAILIATSFAVRLTAWVHWHTGAIESEGAEYARLAENLRSDVGYVGLVTPGPQLNFNPLFPLLIAGTSFLTHNNYELAGRLVALTMGGLLPLPVFGIAKRLFSDRVGFIAAALAVLHPLLIHLSFTVFSEGPYATLFLSAVYVTVRALQQSSIANWLLVGVTFGLTWLLRAEASMGFAIAVLFAFLIAPGDRMDRFKRSLAAIAAFLLLISPEAAFIYRSTGKLKLEGKSTIFSYDAVRILAAERHPDVEFVSPGGQREVPSAEPNVESGMRWEEKWAFFGLDSNFKGMGFAMRPHTEIIREAHVRLGDLFRILVAGTRQNLPVLVQRLSSDWLGAPLLPALALLGALRRPWRGKRTIGRWFFLLVMAAPVAATFLSLRTEQRYYFILIPMLIIFAANGLLGVGLWLKASSTAAGWRMFQSPVLSQMMVPGLLGLAMVLIPVSGMKSVYIFAESAPTTHVDKEIGSWLGSQQSHRNIKVVDLSIPLAYHARAALFSYFPYCSGDAATRYLDAAQVDYIILRRNVHFTRYYQDWLDHGVPDNRAQILQLPSIPGAEKFVVYRWLREGFSSNSTAVLPQAGIATNQSNPTSMVTRQP